MSRIFLSYSRENSETVGTLARDLEDLGHEVWFDQELTGGQVWWDQVLARIRDCDLFVFALAPKALDSHACKLEYTYAYELKKIVLPVLVADGISPNLLPRALSAIQYVDWRGQSKKSAFALVKALNGLPAPLPLPDPLPETPEAPISYLGDIKEEIEAVKTLTFEQQSALLLKLKDHMSNSDESRDVRELLAQLRRRDDLFAKVAKEIDDAIKTADAKSADSQYPPARPTDEESKGPSIAPIKPTEGKDRTPTMDDAGGSPSVSVGSSVVGRLLGRKTVLYNGHSFEIRRMGFIVNETVHYDGREVSSKRSVLGAVHAFRVQEKGEEVQYEVQLGTRWLGGDAYWCVIRRNGKTVFSDR